jgi:predicted transcriptional regulator
MGPSRDVLFRIPDSLVRKMKAAAAEADISASELVRRALAQYCSLDELKAGLRQLHDDDERRNPELRKHRDDLRRKSKSARRRP